MQEDPADRVGQDGWWRAGYFVLGGLYRACFRLSFYGQRNLPEAGPALVACNHISVLDPIAVSMACTERGRTLRFLTAAEFFQRPVMGWGLRKIRQIPIRRGERDQRALEGVADVIRSGALAGIFPEGQLGDGPGLQRGKRGAARIALTGGVPIVPVAVWGTQKRWPKSGLKLTPPPRAPVAVAFGESIDAVGDPRSAADVNALTDRMMDEIGTVLKRLQDLLGK